MGKIIAVNISEKKGTQKKNVHRAKLIEEFGIENDAHAGKWHRQVSLLSYEKIEEFIQNRKKYHYEIVVDGGISEEKIKKFNQVFSGYCDKLYGEKYLLAYNEKWKEEGKFPVSIAALGGNVGTGKKKAVIVAYDLAYMQYSIDAGIQVPYFVIHDKMENTHINQLRTIFEICDDIEGQYIIPILRERIDKIDTKYIEKAKVLELSSTNKFFGV